MLVSTVTKTAWSPTCGLLNCSLSAPPKMSAETKATPATVPSSTATSLRRLRDRRASTSSSPSSSGTGSTPPSSRTFRRLAALGSWGARASFAGGRLPRARGAGVSSRSCRASRSSRSSGSGGRSSARRSRVGVRLKPLSEGARGRAPVEETETEREGSRTSMSSGAKSEARASMGSARGAAVRVGVRPGGLGACVPVLVPVGRRSIPGRDGCRAMAVMLGSESLGGASDSAAETREGGRSLALPSAEREGGLPAPASDALGIALRPGMEGPALMLSSSGSGRPSLASSARRSANSVDISSETWTEPAIHCLVTRNSSRAMPNWRASG